jgi:glycosyltransferase involved in cell wall biosynthesis
VDVLELAGRHPLPDEAAFAAARTLWQRMDAQAVPVIDGLCLPAFARLGQALAARGAVGLIHHPTALEPGHDAATHAALRTAECQMMPLLARTIVTSEPTGDDVMQKFGVPRERLAVVVPGTAPAPRAPGSGGPGCAILSVAVITRRKGHDTLLRALARLPDLDWTLVLAGAPRDPEFVRTLRALAAERGIAERVSFAGEIVAEELEALWQRADLFALATQFEGYGMAIAEALKRGLPVAVTDGGAAGKLVTPASGLVCAVGDDAALARGLRRMIFDTALRVEMAQAAWQLGQSLPDWPAQAELFLAALAA